MRWVCIRGGGLARSKCVLVCFVCKKRKEKKKRAVCVCVCVCVCVLFLSRFYSIRVQCRLSLSSLSFFASFHSRFTQVCSKASTSLLRSTGRRRGQTDKSPKVSSSRLPKRKREMRFEPPLARATLIRVYKKKCKKKGQTLTQTGRRAREQFIHFDTALGICFFFCLLGPCQFFFAFLSTKGD